MWVHPEAVADPSTSQESVISTPRKTEPCDRVQRARPQPFAEQIKSLGVEYEGDSSLTVVKCLVPWRNEAPLEAARFQRAELSGG